MQLPIALIAAIVTQLLCQLFKVFYYSARTGVFSFKYFVTSGGMPSSHSAFVTALGVALAIHNGVASDAFAVAVVFGFIVMHDAYRLRGTVEKQSRLLKLILTDRPAETAELPEMLGHTPLEIAIGVLAGAAVGAGATLLLELLLAPR